MINIPAFNEAVIKALCVNLIVIFLPVSYLIPTKCNKCIYLNFRPFKIANSDFLPSITQSTKIKIKHNLKIHQEIGL